MKTMVIMWAFGLILAVGPMLLLFELTYHFRDKGATRPVIESPFLLALGWGMVICLAMLAALTMLMQGEMMFTFIANSPYALVGFETMAYWIAMMYSRRGRPLKGKWSANP